MNIKHIFESLTPENIKKIPLMRTAMDIFVNVLETNSQISQKITKIFDINYNPDETPIVERSKRNLRIGLFQLYLFTLYKTLNSVAESTAIREELVKFNFENAALYNGIDKIISDEFFSANHLFSQKVGTQIALKYIYEFAKYLETGSIENDLEIIEGDPFYIEYEGSLTGQFFHDVVKPMAHPIGWVQFYTNLISWVLQDYYGIEIISSANKIELQYGAYFVVFIPGSDVSAVYADFRKRINPETKLPYTDEDIDQYVEIITNKIFTSYLSTPTAKENNILVQFEDQTVLYKNGLTGVIYYTTYEDFIAGIINPIKVWGNEWKFNADINTSFRFLYYDKWVEVEKLIDLGRIRDTDHHVGDSEYMLDDVHNCFKVDGDEYIFTPGTAETLDVSENTLDVNAEVDDKFSVKLNYRLFFDSVIKISDTHGHSLDYNLKAGEGIIEVNTFFLQGFDYGVTVSDGIHKDYWYKTVGLNDFDRLLKITSVESNTDNIHIIGTFRNEWWSDAFFRTTSRVNRPLFDFKYAYRKFDTNARVDRPLMEFQRLEFTVYDSKGNTITHVEQNVFESLVDLDFNINTSSLSVGDYYIVAHYFDENGKAHKLWNYEGCGLNDISVIEPFVQLLYYSRGIPHFEFVNTPIDDIELMPGYDSRGPSIKYEIGQNRDGTYLPSEEWLPDIINAVPDAYITGNVVDYINRSKSNVEYMVNEETFIFYGFQHHYIESSDFIIMNSTRYVRDEFDITAETDNHYLYTTDDNYLVTTDDGYLFTSEINWDKHAVYFRANSTVDTRLVYYKF